MRTLFLSFSIALLVIGFAMSAMAWVRDTVPYAPRLFGNPFDGRRWRRMSFYRRYFHTEGGFQRYKTGSRLMGIGGLITAIYWFFFV